MRLPSVTSLVGNVDDRDSFNSNCWRICVTGADGCVYGIPFDARRVVKFNPIDKSSTFIGQDLGDGRSNRWEKGVLANTGKTTVAFIVRLMNANKFSRLTPPMAPRQSLMYKYQSDILRMKDGSRVHLL